MVVRPICEPVELPVNSSLIAERVSVSAGAENIGRFRHFHDVAELVLFKKVEGEFLADGVSYPLGDGAIVFVPSMRQHDFILGDGAMEWVLVQIDPYLVERIAMDSDAVFTRCLCAMPKAEAKSRLHMLADWLTESAADDRRLSERIVEILLLVAAETAAASPSVAAEPSEPTDRLFAALDRLRRSPSEPLDLETAASLCGLSPAYFARRFRQLFGMTFGEYARVYRLHLAARRLVDSRSSISQIAYGSGFSSPAHFSARFRERFDMTPREYRNAARRRAQVGDQWTQ